MLPQLRLLLLSSLLGAALAAVYDMLRAVRPRRTGLVTQALDGVCVALSALTLAAFGMREGGGEVRLYALLHGALGAALYFLLLSPLLRPLWAFWAGSAARLVQLLWLPAAFLGRCAKKLCKSAKKLFHFLRHYATIRGYKWEILLIRRRAEDKGGRLHREKGQKNKARTRLYPHAGATGSHRRRRRRAGEDGQHDQVRPE